MALIVKCKQCGNEIDRAAKKCPLCGYKDQHFNFLLWMSSIVLLIFVGIPCIVSASSKNNPSPAQTNPLNSESALQCGLIDGYQVGMSTANFKESYPKNLPKSSCRTSSPKMVRCDGQLEINNIKTFVSFDFGYGSDYKDGTQFSFGNGKLFGVKGNFEISEFDFVKQEFLKKFGIPKSDNKTSTGYEGISWNKDGNAIMLSQIPDGEGYLFSIIPLDPKRLSACLAAHL